MFKGLKNDDWKNNIINGAEIQTLDYLSKLRKLSKCLLHKRLRLNLL